VGWKLVLRFCQFLPSPEALVVLVIMMVVVEVMDIDMARFEMAREDCILGEQTNTAAISVKRKNSMDRCEINDESEHRPHRLLTD
jgi:hypothetical protein